MSLPSSLSSSSSPSRVEEEFREFDRLAAWPIVFQKLRNESLFEAEEFSLRAARSPLNRNLNRYRDVAPYDHSRVLLKGKSGVPLTGISTDTAT